MTPTPSSLLIWCLYMQYGNDDGKVTMCTPSSLLIWCLYMQYGNDGKVTNVNVPACRVRVRVRVRASVNVPVCRVLLNSQTSFFMQLLFLCAVSEFSSWFRLAMAPVGARIQVTGPRSGAKRAGSTDPESLQ